MRLSIYLVVAILFAVLSQGLSAAENWPQWRGPLGTGVAAPGEYSVKFSDTEGVGWKVKLPGKGSSTPAVWGDRIFVSCAIGESPEAIGFGRGKMKESAAKDGLICYDMNGKELWRAELGTERPGKHPNGSGSNPSPVTDGKHVVVFYKSGTLACFDVDGKKLWQTNLHERFGKDTLWWDLGTSPVLANGCAVVAIQQSPRGQGYGRTGGDDAGEPSQSYLAAFDLPTGDMKWRERREYKCNEESDQSYSTPQVVTIDGKETIVTFGADHLTGHDAATGKLLWESGDFNPRNERAWRTIASMTVGDGVAVIPYGRGQMLAGVKLGGEGDITKTAQRWERPNIAGDVPTPIVTDGKAYVLGDKGRITCLAVETGDELWSANLPKNHSKYYASPVLAGDKLFCTREDGVIFVGQISDNGFKQLAENDMGERVIATPVPIRGGLLVRGEENLFWMGSPAVVKN
jgi:outer membrane protein assembly factor BamB